MKIYKISENMFEDTERDLWFDIVKKQPSMMNHLPEDIDKRFDIKNKLKESLEKSMGLQPNSKPDVKMSKFHDCEWQFRCPICNSLLIDWESEPKPNCEHLQMWAIDETGLLYADDEFKKIIQSTKDYTEQLKQIISDIDTEIWNEEEWGDPIEEWSDQYQFVRAIAQIVSASPEYIVEEKEVSIPHYALEHYLVWKK